MPKRTRSNRSAARPTARAADAKKRRGEKGDPEALRRARLDVSARRTQLVALGIAAFTEEAYDEVSIDDVARKAKISKGLLYHYFPSKKAFYVATLRAAATQLLDSTATDPALPPLERLERGLDAFLLYAEEHGRAYSVLLRGGVSVDREVFKILEATRSRFQTRLLEGLPSELSSASIRVLSRGWVALVETATLEWLERKDLTRAQFRDLLTQTLLAILAQTSAVPEPKRRRGRK